MFKIPPENRRGFVFDFLTKAKGRENPAPSFFGLPVAEATAAKGTGMPAGRTIIHRAAAAIGPAMPTGSAPTRNGNRRGIARCRLIERRHGHGLRHRDRCKADSCCEHGCSNDLHEHSFLMFIAVKNDLSDKYAYATSPVVTMVPMAVPVAMMPAVMIPAAMPAAMMPVMMAPMVVPVDLYGLDLIDLVLRHHGRLNICRRYAHRSRNRRQGSGLCGSCKYGSAQHQPRAETQKDGSLHDFMPFPGT